MENTITIKISKETHSRIKNYCDKNALKIAAWADNVLREKLDKLNNK